MERLLGDVLTIGAIVVIVGIILFVLWLIWLFGWGIVHAVME